MLRRGFFRTGAFLVLLVLGVVPSSAVPMWSRRYGVACSTCHSFPSLQLTATGLDFFRRGHRMQGDTFDKEIPHLISAHGEWAYQVQEKAATAFESPELHFHIGGALSPLFSIYVDANVNSDFEAAYLQFTKSQGKDAFFTARAGKLSPTIIRDYGNGLMASASTPLVLTDATLGNNPFTPARDDYGVDLGQQWKELFFQVGVLNGLDVPGQAAVQNHKDLYGSVEWNRPDEPTGVGVYYHRGGYDLGTEAPDLVFDRYDRIAGFLNYTTDRFRLAGAYLTGKDRRDALPDLKIHGFYVQADTHLGDWGAPFVRYDDVKTEADEGTGRTKQWTAGCSLRLFENDVNAGRAVIELSRKDEAGVRTNSALLNIIWAF